MAGKKGSGGCQKHTERFDVRDKCVCAHVHMPWLNVHPSVCFFPAALQVQRPAAALPRMPGAWIIPPSPSSHPLYSLQERLLKHMESITTEEEGGTRKKEEGHRSWERWIWQKLEKGGGGSFFRGQIHCWKSSLTSPDGKSAGFYEFGREPVRMSHSKQMSPIIFVACSCLVAIQSS